MRLNYCDYIVFADESGDHSLKSIDPEFPVFALTFCIISKADYTARVVPAIQDFKFRYWGHDTAILHEHEIRKSKGEFAFLRASADVRQRFQTELSERWFGLSEQAPGVSKWFSALFTPPPLRVLAA